MKKTILLLSMIFAVVANISAQTVSINATSDGQTYTSTAEIKTSSDSKVRTIDFSVLLSGASNTETAAYQFDVNVPKGYKVDENSIGLSNGNLTSNSLSFTRVSGNNDYNGSLYRLVYEENSVGKDFNGEIGHFTVSVDKSIEENKQVFSISNIVLVNVTKVETGKGKHKQTSYTISSINPSEATLTITQPAPTTAKLDETSTEGIIAQLSKQNITAGQEIDELTINRTIKAGRWNTIILPVSLTESEMKKNFGDATICEFVGFGVSDTTVQGQPINWYFYTKKYTGNIQANVAYFIKVNSDVSSIQLNNKVISSSQEDYVDKSLNCTDGSAAKSKHLSFFGVYTSTIVPENGLYLSGNKYWFSPKNDPAPLNAFRAYIDGVNVASMDEGSIVQNSKFNMTVDDDTVISGIDDVVSKPDNKNSYIYNLSGQNLGKDRSKLSKGLYIQNGKKFIIE